ncbi:MAG: Cbb3-type cytochrome c oxidase subunit [Rhodomicrobium sp.]|nr:MAG: Cbb3-type cytochrome c oxidase subunit [Rhodomicrobium sp.]
MTKNEIDEISGTETTGHDWDGIRELDTPMPRWWLWTFYACILFSLVYVILYPAIPLVNGATKGWLGYSTRIELKNSIDVALDEQKESRLKIENASLAEIKADPTLLSFAQAGGRAAFKVNCIQCHGSGAEGSKGNPNLNDDDWLWGGSLETIHQTILHGIRYEQDDDTRLSQMPAFGTDELLTPAEIDAVADYVISLSKAETPPGGEGADLFAANCASCHGENGGGNPEMGAPALNDQIWLYGGSKETVVESITKSRRAVMPAWAARLDAATIKQLAIYVHGLGGGQ